MSHAQHDTQLTQLVQWVNGKFAETWPEAADMAFAAIEKSTAIDGTPDVARSNITCVLRGALESGIYSCGCVQRGYGSDGRPVNTVRAPAPPTGSTRTHTCRDPCMQAREPGAAARHKGAIIGGGGTAAERKHDSGARAAVAAARARDKPEPGARARAQTALHCTVGRLREVRVARWKVRRGRTYQTARARACTCTGHDVSRARVMMCRALPLHSPPRSYVVNAVWVVARAALDASASVVYGFASVFVFFNMLAILLSSGARCRDACTRGAATAALHGC
jgi:hypothetical protein